jgi:hypothetical protein
LLTKKLGEPDNELNQNLLAEIIKKINSYYAEPEEQNYTTYSSVGYLTEISDRRFKEGPKKGQVYYVLKLGGAGKEVLQARKEDLTEEQWSQIKNLALLGKNLVFKYKKYFSNKQIIDFYPQSKK